MALMSNGIGMIATYSLVTWKELGAITFKLDLEGTTFPITIKLSHKYHISHLAIKLGAHGALIENKIPLILCHLLTSPSFIFPCQFYLFFPNGAFQFQCLCGYIVYLRVWTKSCEDEGCKIVTRIAEFMVFDVIRI
jgi:hypothetical protein